MHHLLPGNDRVRLSVPVPLPPAARPGGLHRPRPPPPLPRHVAGRPPVGQPGPHGSLNCPLMASRGRLITNAVLDLPLAISPTLPTLPHHAERAPYGSRRRPAL